ncbi:MAG: 50S ribosomal protein L11 methyltransferase [Chloroflexi bacterium]|nr:MAG: 50S ribosomal protein L11 methyltransferase [Chloroflexota bacterium]
MERESEVWLEVTVTVDGEAAEAVADLLSQYAPGGVALETGPAGFPNGPVTVRAYLPPHQDTPQVRRRIEEGLWHLRQIHPIPPPIFRPVREEDWAEAWKAHFRPLRVGRHLLIKPTWQEAEVSPEDVVIELDPGMAFGTGLHPTTRLCLEFLEERLRPGMTVLDLGTGSGILAITAARLGAASVLAVDTDPLAVRIARQNVEINGVADVVGVRLGSLAEADDQYDLVLVNIVARVIIGMARAGLSRRLKPEGELLVTGIVQGQEDEVAQALRQSGLVLVEERRSGDWVALVGRRLPALARG